MWWEKPGNLEVRNNRLFFAGKDTAELASEFGTPLYVYNAERIKHNYSAIEDSFKNSGCTNFSVQYAMKANSSLAILSLLKNLGSGIDATSVGEVELALNLGFPKEKIMFTGTSVSNQDLEQLAELNILINIDSFSQMRRLAKIGFEGPVSIRWNPGLDGELHTHANIITAGKYVKFGIPQNRIFEAFEEAKSLKLDVQGLHQHIGSGWLGEDVRSFIETVSHTLDVAKKAEEIMGQKFKFIDFGGGPGIPYKREQNPFPLEKWAFEIVDTVKASGLSSEIRVEPGRYLVGDAGVLLLEINTVEEKNIPVLGVNGGFTTLARPAMYGAFHELVVCENVNGRSRKEFMVAGNLCESGDVFTEDKKTLRELPVPEEGNNLAILNAGAYGFAMASSYNSQPLPAEVLIENGKPRLVRERGTINNMFGNQKK